LKRLQLQNVITRNLGPVNFHIDAGECVCLSGPSGSGKTILLRVIADLDPHEGEIYLDTRACNAISGPEWRHQVGLLASESFWWGHKVVEHYNGCETINAESLGFSEQVEDWNIERLSSGEKQRLALLRLLCNKPKVLLLDEPTANLDEKSRTLVEQLVLQYKHDQQAAVLWVSHDINQMERVADRVLIITGNTLIEQERARKGK